MQLTLTCVRHGEALHNLATRPDLTPSYTEDGILDTPLTSLGVQQIDKVGHRLAGDKFDLAISSDLQRARDTALAIMQHHAGLELEQWKCCRERAFGLVEKSSEHGAKLLMCILEVKLN